MRRTLLVFLLVFQGCSTSPVKEDATLHGLKNACLPEAAIMAKALNKSGISSKVLCMSFRSGVKQWGHAVCYYTLDNGSKWCWDSYWKSLRVRPVSESAQAVARSYALCLPNLAKNTIISSSFFAE